MIHATKVETIQIAEDLHTRIMLQPCEQTCLAVYLDPLTGEVQEPGLCIRCLAKHRRAIAIKALHEMETKEV